MKVYGTFVDTFVGVDDAVPQVLAVGRPLYQQGARVEVGDAREGINAVELSAPGHLHEVVGVALAVGYQTAGEIGVLTNIILVAMVIFCPLEMLRMGGESDQRK